MNFIHLLILFFLICTAPHHVSAMEQKGHDASEPSLEVCLYITMPHVDILRQRLSEASLLPFAYVTNIINELGTTDFFECGRDVQSVVEVVDRALEFYAHFYDKHCIGSLDSVREKRDLILELILKDHHRALEYLKNQKK